jgi:class 3 adenylate cyclase
MADDRFAAQRTQITHVGRLRAALMMTDIVGYSRRMHADETRAMEELRRHNQLVRAALEGHQGREVKTAGDSFLAEFASVDDALACALSIQERIAETFAGTDPLQLRIGLHVAEVEVIGPDVIGDGVNILARIEPQSAPGGLCASKDFVDALLIKPVELFPMGQVELKNIARPLELFAWPRPTLSAQPARKVTGGVPPPAAFDPDEVPTSAMRPGTVQPFSDARPLSRSSGILGELSVPEEATVTGPVDARPANRGTQPTRDAPAVKAPEPTRSMRRQAEPSDVSITQDQSGVTRSDAGLPRVVMPPPHKPRGPLVLVGSVVGGVCALSLAGIGWMVGHSGKPAAPPPETVVVSVNRPVPVPVAPIAPPVVAPAPAPAPAVEKAPAAAAPSTKAPSVSELVASARRRIKDSHLKPRDKKGLLADVSKLEKKYSHARAGKPKRDAEAALRRYLKRHKLAG